MKRIFGISLAILLVCLLVAGCGNKEKKVDYPNVTDFETALNNGEDLTGKTVTFTVQEYVPNSAFGYNLQAGEHLNFCSSKNPGVKEGDTLTVKVTSVSSVLGSYIVEYKVVS